MGTQYFGMVLNGLGSRHEPNYQMGPKRGPYPYFSGLGTGHEPNYQMGPKRGPYPYFSGWGLWVAR